MGGEVRNCGKINYKTNALRLVVQNLTSLGRASLKGGKEEPPLFVASFSEKNDDEKPRRLNEKGKIKLT